MASRLFGGTKLTDIAKEVKERAAAAPTEPARPARVPAAELALSGRSTPTMERENILSVDPKRCRPWAFHNRTDAWYTKEGCQDLIDSLPRDGQMEPALGRRLHGDPNFDFELIYGLRRRFAAEATHTKLKVRVTDADDARCAVLMHIENADRQDITAMERAISFLQQLEAKVFVTQEAMADAFGLGGPQMTKMLKAAQLFKHPSLAHLFPNKRGVPVAGSYELMTLMERPGGKEVILKAAQNLSARGEGAKPPAAVLKYLAASLVRTKQLEPLRREYHVGASRRMTVVRNPKGKVTMAFPQGLRDSDREGLLAAIEKMLKDLG